MKTLNISALFVSVLLVSCSREPVPLSYGKDPCEHCKMTIMDTKYGAEIVTAKGKIFKFDAAECMVDFINDNPGKYNAPGDMLLTTNVAAPETLIDARSAFFLKDKAFKSPMGGNLASFNSRQLAENNLQNADGTILTWDELLSGR
ncbi:MAG TPA: nitrous oxide reductase accessory protein NosL [Sphingobacteriaceae bacterium]